MISLLSSALVALMAVPQPQPLSIIGGTPEEHLEIRNALKGIPECLLGPDRDEVKIRVVRAEDFNASYNPGSGEIVINTPVIDEKELVAAKATLAVHHCTTPATLDDFTHADRVLLHEVAHRYQFGSVAEFVTELRLDLGRPIGSKSTVTKTPIVRANEFLDLRFRSESDAWHENPLRVETIRVLKALHQTVQELRERGRPVPPAILTKMCELEAVLQDQYEREFGMPARYANDRHAFSNPSGAEYFAMAIETLVYDHAVFCKVYSQTERDWLAIELGDCLFQLPHLASCFDAPRTSKRQPPRSSGGGKFLTP